MNDVLTIQRTGRKPGNRAVESQDRLLARELECGRLLAVADGITTGAFGGSVARWVVDRHLAKDAITLGETHDTGRAFRDYLGGLYVMFQAEFAEMPDMLASGCCLVALVVRGNRWFCCSVGDCQAFLLRREKTGFAGIQITRPHLDRRSGFLTDCFGNQAPRAFRTEEGVLREGDVLVLTSDGAKLDEVSLPEDLRRSGFTEAWLTELAERAMTGRTWDDIAVVAYRHTTTNEGGS